MVVITGCEDDILPHINSQDDEHGLEEERRLFYVALTRAEKRVYLLHAARRRRFGTWQDSLPSRFLAEVPDELIERRHLDTAQHRIQQPRGPQPVRRAGGDRSRDVGTGRPGSRQQLSVPSGPPGRVGSAQPQASHARRQPMPDWDATMSSRTRPYYEGQTVSHGIFGTGSVVRVEGSGRRHDGHGGFPRGRPQAHQPAVRPPGAGGLTDRGVSSQ